MKKTITLTKSNVARLEDTEPFLMPDKLIFEFNSVGYDLKNAFVSLQNGTVKMLYKLTDYFVVDEKVLFAGVLNVGIHLYRDGKCIKSWYCLPIKIVEVEHKVYGFDVLSEFEKRIKALEDNNITKESHVNLAKSHNELATKHNELAETVSEIKEKIKEI